MGKEILSFRNTEIEKKKQQILPPNFKTPIFLGDVDIEKVLVSNKISLEKKTISTLLVTCILVIKLNH